MLERIYKVKKQKKMENILLSSVPYLTKLNCNPFSSSHVSNFTRFDFTYLSVKEARLKEIKSEILNSEKLKVRIRSIS